jgi:hypothetical protein
VKELKFYPRPFLGKKLNLLHEMPGAEDESTKKALTSVIELYKSRGKKVEAVIILN